MNSDEQFDIQVPGLTVGEFMAAGDQMLLNMLPPLLILVTVVTVVILAFTRITFLGIVSPYVVVALCIGVYLILLRSQYKKLPENLSFSYLIDSDGWQLTLGEEKANIDWVDTPRLVERRHIFLLYHQENSSNVLPKRVLTEHQMECIRSWYRDSRDDQKRRERARWMTERQERKARWKNNASGRKHGLF